MKVTSMPLNVGKIDHKSNSLDKHQPRPSLLWRAVEYDVIRWCQTLSQASARSTARSRVNHDKALERDQLLT